MDAASSSSPLAISTPPNLFPTASPRRGIDAAITHAVSRDHFDRLDRPARQIITPDDDRDATLASLPNPLPN
jgi:hypothetical protein